MADGFLNFYQNLFNFHNEIIQSGFELSEPSRSVIMLATSPEFFNKLLE